jgi:hypothetical protein
MIGVRLDYEREARKMRKPDDFDPKPDPNRYSGMPFKDPLGETLALLEQSEGDEIAEIVRRAIVREPRVPQKD